MIPSDVAGRLQSTVDTSVRPAPPVRDVANALSDLIPGQRVLAEIQALLPNGAYRAIVNQRDITLALPFSAKAGDSLELEVVDNEGKLALAVVAKRTQPAEGTAAGERPAVETTLSRTGNFIASLLAKGSDGQPAQPARLNANQPIAAAPPGKGADIAPLLKEAITQSGMFYESHQSQWVEQKLPLDALLSQPQGRHSTTPPPVAGEAPQRAAGENTPATSQQPVTGAEKPAKAPETAAAAQTVAATAPDQTAASSRPAAMGTQIVAADLMPIVQQQLEALASQTYVWQGQAWPGQEMRWEIVEEDGGRRQQDGDADQPPWQTRLTLTMPQLGEVRAALRIVGGELTLALSSASEASTARLAGGSEALRGQLEAAGLKLTGLSVGRHDRPAE